MNRYRTQYPPNWAALSSAIRVQRARGCCERCGAENGKPHPITGSTVQLSVAHLGVPRVDGSAGDKHDKSDCRPENLAALCQRCHLNFDREDHQIKARATRARKRRERLASRGWVQLALEYAPLASSTR